MRRLLRAAAIAMLIVASLSCRASDRRPLRLSVSQFQPVSSQVRDYSNNTRGATIEYSLGDTFRGENSPSDACVSLSYMRIDYVQFDTRDATKTIRYDVKSDIVTFGVNWRFGAGADPARDGYYVGAGVGVAFGSPAIDTGQLGFGGLKSGRNGQAMEWRLMAGMNLASATFGELTYRKVGSDGVYALNVGVRL